MRILHNVKVAGTTFDNRQATLAQLTGSEPVRLVPEPTNAYDPNAIAVQVAIKGAVAHVGYVPRETAAKIATYLEGEALECKIEAITGGFELSDGEIANYGLRLTIEFPDEMIVEHDDSDIPF